MEFSVVLISKNEEKTLPRLLASLKGIEDIVLVDTGSTDRTVEVAKGFGVRVFEEGTRFLETVTEEMAVAINLELDPSEEPVVKPGDTAFNYSKARNYAASLAKNDMIFMPDCDEVVTWDLERLKAEIEGVDRLEYNFVFAHDDNGKPLVEFMHSKFYDRRKFEWVRIIHEILHGDGVSKYLTPDIIKLDHWQNHSSNRDHYLRGLAIDCFINKYNDRNTHYYGRELMYKGRYKSAIKVLEKHAANPGWIMEQAQSLTFIGDCYRNMGDRESAIASYLRAIQKYPQKREAYYSIASLYFENKEFDNAVVFFTAAVQISKPNFYATFAPIYEDWPWGNLAVALWNIGRKDQAFEALKEALKYSPENPMYLQNLQYSIPCPKISVIIPTLKRKESLARLVEEIKKNAGYSNYEIIVVHDGEPKVQFEGVRSFNTPERQGVAKAFKFGVEQAEGSLIMYLGNDVIPQPNFMIQALWKMYQDFGQHYVGLCALNDGMWNGTLATHWVAHKALLKALDGEFFHTGYHHVGVDNELTGRVKTLGCYTYAPLAKIEHNTPDDEVKKIAWDPEKVHADRLLLRKRAEELGFIDHLDDFMKNYPITNG